MPWEKNYKSIRLREWERESESESESGKAGGFNAETQRAQRRGVRVKVESGARGAHALPTKRLFGWGAVLRKWRRASALFTWAGGDGENVSVLA